MEIVSIKICLEITDVAILFYTFFGIRLAEDEIKTPPQTLTTPYGMLRYQFSKQYKHQPTDTEKIPENTTFTYGNKNATERTKHYTTHSKDPLDKNETAFGSIVIGKC